MKKYIVAIEVEIEANDMEDAENRADEIRVYFSLHNGGDELDPLITSVTEAENVN